MQLCKTCSSRDVEHARKGVCNRCYQRSRSRLPHVVSMRKSSSRKWYDNGGREKIAAANRRFRDDRPLWSIYIGIMRRTADKPDRSTPHWKHYGGRGIRMFAAWRGNYRLFEADVLRECGPRPVGWSIDRIDNDGHYEPGNVRWADSTTQRANTREQIALRERPVMLSRLARIEAMIDSALTATMERQAA